MSGRCRARSVSSKAPLPIGRGAWHIGPAGVDCLPLSCRRWWGSSPQRCRQDYVPDPDVEHPGVRAVIRVECLAVERWRGFHFRLEHKVFHGHQFQPVPIVRTRSKHQDFGLIPRDLAVGQVTKVGVVVAHPPDPWQLQASRNVGVPASRGCLRHGVIRRNQATKLRDLRGGRRRHRIGRNGMRTAVRGLSNGLDFSGGIAAGHHQASGEEKRKRSHGILHSERGFQDHETGAGDERSAVGLLLPISGNTLGEMS